MYLAIATTAVFAFMAIVMIFVRMRASRKPASVKKIILPPFFMSTGALMFLFPMFQISWLQVAEALTVGIIFSIFLIKTSKLEFSDGEIYVKPSKMFPVILIGLLVIRIIIKLIIGTSISVGETSGMFFLLAFGMIGTWRIAMLYQYVQLTKKQSA
ncbi:protein CcdC [Oceanobacillus oncorhynchi subsp. incaldanensis]|uniref:CcdC family protein n=1 Tax=Oceanobacillus aidingensis TaxID=645964 RepID=A0ABV9K3Q2_9BACI|nr:cytochrome c biogenesis protein CcdC [Oceanobacillus oncorhynchi]MDM8099559.1 cytochrome c biogenesis protein CcdC [Oceanobacillus oncorhynchi]UUI41984.1 cytochrome c biogenesis protein CcdC [Oceanobacillus oncorhynchi]GIO20021.1 protein CcdC [Oceanobacillus oncorhynchi subsp. incaldanensis]